jgi:IS1 family transposase
MLWRESFGANTTTFVFVHNVDCTRGHSSDHPLGANFKTMWICFRYADAYFPYRCLLADRHAMHHQHETKKFERNSLNYPTN